MTATLLPFIFIIFTGIIYRKIVGKDRSEQTANALSATVLHVFLPALCIKTIYNSKLESSILLVTASAWITIFLCLLISIFVYYLFDKIYSIRDSQKGVLIISGIYGNVTYLGIPVLTGLFGDESAKYALFYDLFATTPLLWLLGAPIAMRYGLGKKMRIRESLREISVLPPIWAMLAALLLNISNVYIPQIFLKTFEILSNAVIPLMIFRVGLALSVPDIRFTYIALPAIIIKLIVSPLISLMVSKSIGLKDIPLGASILEGAMPTMVLSIIIAWRFNLDTSLSAFMIISTTFLSIFTIPFFIYFVR